MSGDWAVQWKKTKTEFEALTGKKKPSPTVLGVFKTTSGLETALKACDAAEKAMGGKALSEETLKAFAAKAKAFTAAKNAYVGVLKSAIAKEKGIDSAYAKGLDILTKELTALDATISGQIGYNAAALKKLSGTETVAANLVEATKAAAKRALVFAAKVKAKPTVKDFNDGIVKAARDVTQQIGNAEKLRGKGHKFPAGDPTKLFNVMTPWAQGKRMLKDGVPNGHIVREVKAFEQAVAGAAKWAESA